MNAQWLISVVPSQIFSNASEPDSYQESVHPLLRMGVLSYRKVNSNNNNHWLPFIECLLCVMRMAKCFIYYIVSINGYIDRVHKQWPVGQIKLSSVLYLAHVVLAHIIGLFSVSFLPTF